MFFAAVFGPQVHNQAQGKETVDGGRGARRGFECGTNRKSALCVPPAPSSMKNRFIPNFALAQAPFLGLI